MNIVVSIFDMVKRKVFCEICKRSRMRKSIVFESLNGFDGSSRQLYEYILAHDIRPEYKLIWVVENPQKYSHVVQERTEFYKYSDMKFDCALAEYVFFEYIPPMSKYLDSQTYVFLSHGQPPLKASGIQYDMVTHSLCTTPQILDIWKKWIITPNAKYIFSELPKNDSLLKPYNLAEYFGEKKVILFMPTFRHFINQEVDDSRKAPLFDIPVIDCLDLWYKLDDFCVSKNVEIIVKPHPKAQIEDKSFPKLRNIMLLPNSKVLDEDIDICRLLGAADGMISDYSTIACDFMLLDRPLAYDVSDLENGDYKREFLYDNPLEYMPGNKIRSFNDILEYIECIANEKDPYKNDRERIRQKTHGNFDGHASEHVLREIGLI